MLRVRARTARMWRGAALRRVGRTLSSAAGGARKPFNKLLVANRGEIACRVMKTCKKLGIKTVAVYSEPDAKGVHVQMADEAVCIGPAASAESYLRIDRILDAIEQTGAEAVHPGYGFLSENSEFSNALAERGVKFVGPGKYAIDCMGDKIASKKIALEAKVNTIPGHVGAVEGDSELLKVANEIGYPVMIKASAGGGGKGMRIAWNDEEAIQGLRLSKQEAAASFGDDTIFVEKFVEEPRHIEIQVVCDAHGNGIYLNERECSVQRRNQKVIEEAPSVFLDPSTRAAMGKQAVQLAKAVNYESAGTVEFLVDKNKDFYFLEMNTRLQVEHPITELITGVDLVEQMLRVAAGEKLSITQDDIGINGWALESRVYAEDPYREFLPSTGLLTGYKEPTGAGVRTDSGVREGSEISMFYDPMISKLCTWGKDRTEALALMRRALDEYQIRGVRHNVPFLRALCDHPSFIAGDLTTNFIAEHYPEGFAGVEMSSDEWASFAASVAALYRASLRAKASLSGMSTADADAWVAEQISSFVARVGGGPTLAVTCEGVSGPQDALSIDVLDEVSGDRSSVHVAAPGYTEGAASCEAEVFRAGLDGVRTDVLVQVLASEAPRYKMTFKGEEFVVDVLTPRANELSQFMPEVEELDMSKLVVSPMPGLVFSLAVKEGDQVKAGQEVCVVEAMKMQNALVVPVSGTIAKVNVKTGESVDADQILIELE